jgi:hypothetical protein
MDEVVTFGEEGDKFYVIIKGVVSVLIPNPSAVSQAGIPKGMTITMMKREYDNVLKWKKHVFDIRMEEAKLERLDTY